MGKIVKFCSSCEESFAEKFGFCPTCGATLQAFEMSPVAAAPAPPEPEFIAEREVVPAEVIEFSEPAVTEVIAADTAEPIEEESEVIAPEEVVAAPEKVVEIPAPTAPVFIQTTALDADAVTDRPMILTPLPDDDFGVTVIEEKNGSRNGLLLGTFVLMVAGMTGGLVYNIFSKDLGVGSLDDGVFSAVILDDPAMMIEEKEPEKKDDDDGGGGGGGGKNESEPASQGARPPMMKTVTFPPSAHMERLTNPTIRIDMGIQGPKDELTRDPNQRYGIPDSSNISGISDGPGTGGGIGTGRGTGVGSGNGTGAGTGNGSGLGGGNGTGIGDGEGPGTGGTKPPPAARAGVTQGLKIISKPRAGYTDSARQNNVTGKVVLRITFLANGSIGSITPVSGLGYGLTEQAIAAARRIVFEPAKVNGVSQTTTKTFEYGFSIY